MEYIFEGKTRVLVLDERVYRGKTKLYIAISEDLGLIRIVGNGLYMLGSFEVYLRRSRSLYYLVEAKPISDYRDIIKDPKSLQVFSKVYKGLTVSPHLRKDLYGVLKNFLEQCQRDPSKYESLINLDPEEILEGLV